MPQTTPELLDAVLRLPPATRAEFAERLLDSLPNEFEAGDDAEFGEELDRRLDEHRRNPDAAISWDELKQ